MTWNTNPHANCHVHIMMATNIPIWQRSRHVTLETVVRISKTGVPLHRHWKLVAFQPDFSLLWYTTDLPLIAKWSPSTTGWVVGERITDMQPEIWAYESYSHEFVGTLGKPRPHESQPDFSSTTINAWLITIPYFMRIIFTKWALTAQCLATFNKLRHYSYKKYTHFLLRILKVTSKRPKVEILTVASMPNV